MEWAFQVRLGIHTKEPNFTEILERIGITGFAWLEEAVSIGHSRGPK